MPLSSMLLTFLHRLPALGAFWTAGTGRLLDHAMGQLVDVGLIDHAA